MYIIYIIVFLLKLTKVYKTFALFMLQSPFRVEKIDIDARTLIYIAEV